MLLYALAISKIRIDVVPPVMTSFLAEGGPGGLDTRVLA